MAWSKLEKVAVLWGLAGILWALWEVKNAVEQEHFHAQSFRQRFALHFPYKREAEMKDEYGPNLKPTTPEYHFTEGQR